MLAALVAVASLAGGVFLFAQHSNTGDANLGVTVNPAVQLTTNGTTNVSLWIRLATGGTGYLWGDSSTTCTSPIGTATTFTSGKHDGILLSSIQFTSSDAYVCAYGSGVTPLSAFVVWPHTDASLAFGQQPTSTTAGASISPPVTVKVLDSNGALDTGSTASVTLAIGTNPSGGTLSGTVTQSAVNGVATFSNLSIDKAGSGYTLTATSTGLTPSQPSTPFNITSGAASATVSTVSASLTAVDANNSATSTITVTLLDANSNPVSGKNVTLTASSGSSTITPAGGGNTNSSGVMTFTVKDSTAQSVTYTAKDTPDNITITSSTPTITFFTATAVAFAQQPTSAVSGATISPPVTVQLKNGTNNASTAGVNITLSLTGTGTLSGTLTQVTNGTGLATFNNLSVDLVGSKTLTATASGPLTSPASNAFTISVGAVSASKSTVTASQTSVLANGTATSTITVTLTDAAGNPVSGKNVTLTASSGSSTITPAGGGNTNSSGVMTFTVKDSTAQSVTYTAKDTPDNITITSSTPTITFFTATAVAFAQQPTSAVSGATISPPVTVQLKNGTNNASTAGVNITLSPSSGTLNGTLTQATNASGLATFSDLSINTAATGYTLTAASSGLTSATSSPFNITAAPASATVSTVTASPASVVADGTTTSTITVTVKDAFGNLESGDTVTLTAGSGSSTITPPPPGGGTTNGSGVVTFTVKDSTAEAVTYTAADTTDSVTITQTAKVTFTASKLVFTSAAFDYSTASECSPQITVQTQDANGNMADPSSTVTVTPKSSSNGSTGFYSNSGCTTSITTVTISTSANSASFYYESNKTLPTITAEATGGVTSSPTQDEDTGATY